MSRYVSCLQDGGEATIVALRVHTQFITLSFQHQGYRVHSWVTFAHASV